MTTPQDLERTISAERQAIYEQVDRPVPQRLPAPALKYGLKRSIQEFGSDKGTDRAAVGTYFAVLSLAPAMLAVFSVLTLVLASAADTVENFAEGFVTRAVPDEYQDLALNLIDTMTNSASGGSHRANYWCCSCPVVCISICQSVLTQHEYCLRRG